MDRAKFAKDFTGGYGGVVDGPYYSGSWMYKAAVDQGMILNAYATSVDSAIEVLTEGGWVYDAEGNDYVEGVRYKKIPGDIATENDINYKSKDGAYVTTKVGDDYYMPLVLNWYGTSDNPFTDQLMTGFASNDNVIAAGFNVQYTIGDFSPCWTNCIRLRCTATILAAPCTPCSTSRPVSPLLRMTTPTR